MPRTDQQILTVLQYAAMESPDLGATWPSGLWTREEVLAYLNERQNRFLKATLIQLGVTQTDNLNPIPARQSIIPLPPDWIATVSVYWTGSDGTTRELVRADSFEADHGDPLWTTTAGTPLFYLDYAQPTLQLRIGPIPDQPGLINLLYVPMAEALTGDGDVNAQLPDEFVDAALKYGPLADMFTKDGRGKNPEKAAYCEDRFHLGIEAAAIILAGRT